MRWDCMSKALRFLCITAEHQDRPFFTVFLTIKTSSRNIPISCRSIPLKLRTNVAEAIGGGNSFPWTILEEQFPVQRNSATSKIGKASFCCYDNSDVIATLIITNFHLYLIRSMWWQFFQIFVYGDVGYTQTLEILTLKNCIEPLQNVTRNCSRALFS